ncbi:MAG TPA: histidine ammonia-lyase [Phycisphaerae bacterium]|nr:histidine ammonia-lyase [Phycisphaerae bacterium]
MKRNSQPSDQRETTPAHAVHLDGSPLTLVQLDAAYDRPLQVSISDEVWAAIRAARAKIEAHLAGGEVIYGVNTGFGKLCNKRIAPDEVEKLQENLIISHAVGVGPPIPLELVRFMMLFKIVALAAGASGVQPAVIECLAAMLNADCLPVIPTRGSLGASGDLAPLAHMVLPMIARGDVSVAGNVRPAAGAFEELGIKPVKLGAKDGLALVNGTQMMLAYAAAICVRARRLAKHADLLASMSLEALRGSLKPFDEGLIALRPHPGAVEVAANIRRLMADSEILVSHANCDKVQDPYSLRCVPQVHGACRDALRHATETVLIELRSITDNPVLVNGEVISGGNFHGEPLALTLDYLAMALTEWASISERRTYLLTLGHDGLPPLLMKNTGLNSGFMMPQYTAAALVNECKVLSHPASVDTIPSSLGQEDHVSMGATSALKCWQIIDNAETVLAIELLCAGQALDYRLPTKPGLGPRLALEALRQSIPHAEADRAFGEDIQTALRLLRKQAVLAPVEKALSRLD